ncbi:MAG: hypothetical protein P1Q69_11045 [Candidatus Thorarchaeota archaeon]|nr:hypothetical protein [Candidatus Thorarchaeota archaeon]
MEPMKSDTELMSFGAEVYGLEPVFSASKWNAGGCGDWALDEQFLVDYPHEAKQYLKDIKRMGEVCILCLWIFLIFHLSPFFHLLLPRFVLPYS